MTNDERTKITLDTPIKFLTATGRGTYSDHPSYSPGRKLTVRGPLVLCKNGYHWTTPRNWHEWANAQCWLVEPSEETVHDDNKSCSRSIKLVRQLDTWNDRSARLLACEIAETVLHLTTDPRPAETIAVARRFARGQATEEELAVASEAAWAAREAASWAASEAASEAASRAALWRASWRASRAASESASAVWAAWASWAASRAASWAASVAASWASVAASRDHHAQLFLETLQGLRNQE